MCCLLGQWKGKEQRWVVGRLGVVENRGYPNVLGWTRLLDSLENRNFFDVAVFHELEGSAEWKGKEDWPTGSYETQERFIVEAEAKAVGSVRALKGHVRFAQRLRYWSIAEVVDAHLYSGQ
jgi:hypothetical protein